MLRNAGHCGAQLLYPFDGRFPSLEDGQRLKHWITQVVANSIRIFTSCLQICTRATWRHWQKKGSMDGWMERRQEENPNSSRFRLYLHLLSNISIKLWSTMERDFSLWLHNLTFPTLSFPPPPRCSFSPLLRAFPRFYPPLQPFRIPNHLTS